MLESDIKSDNLSHAYLLVGPSHVGKYTVAKKLAYILQCPNNYCGACPTCTQIRKKSHIDTMEFTNNRESIKIEQVREIVSRAQMSTQSRYKVVLLQAIGRMTPEAANCLLKTLEEPTEKTVFIMTASHVREILPTIVSRSRVMRFHSFSTEFLEKTLVEKFPESDAETVGDVARLALGKSGRAFDLMDQPEELAYHLKLYRDVQSILKIEDVVEKFRYADELAEDEKKRRNFLNTMMHVLRGQLLEGGAAGGGSVDRERVIRLISDVENAKSSLKQNVNSKLVLENLLLTT